MDLGTVLTGVIGLGAALGGGAAGNKLGRKVGGEKPWHKLLAPAGAGAIGMIYQGITGDDKTATTIAVDGAALGAVATGVFSAGKNIGQLFGLFK